MRRVLRARNNADILLGKKGSTRHKLSSRVLDPDGDCIEGFLHHNHIVMAKNSPRPSLRHVPDRIFLAESVTSEPDAAQQVGTTALSSMSG